MVTHPHSWVVYGHCTLIQLIAYSIFQEDISSNVMGLGKVVRYWCGRGDMVPFSIKKNQNVSTYGAW